MHTLLFILVFCIGYEMLCESARDETTILWDAGAVVFLLTGLGATFSAIIPGVVSCS